MATTRPYLSIPALPADDMVLFDPPPRTDFQCAQATWTTSSEFGELVQWCNNFAGALQSVIAVLLEDIARVEGMSQGMSDDTIESDQLIDTELQLILNIVDQVHDIVTSIERVSRRAAISAHSAEQNPGQELS